MADQKNLETTTREPIIREEREAFLQWADATLRADVNPNGTLVVHACWVRAYEFRLQQLEEALRRCDKAAQRFWKAKSAICAGEDLEVVEAGRHAHETLLAGDPK